METASTEAAAPAREILITRVLTVSFTVLFRNFGRLFLLACLGSLPLLGDSVVTAIAFNGGMTGGRGTNSEFLTPWLGVITWIGIGLIILGNTAGFAAIFHATSRLLSGEEMSIWQSFKHGLARTPRLIIPFLIIVLLVALTVGSALTLLGIWPERYNPLLFVILIPGVLLLAMWFVAMPACVVERVGVGKSLERSRKLTQDNRVKILVIFVATAIVIALVNITALQVEKVAPLAVKLGAGLAYGGFIGAFWAVVLAVTYHELRQVKEGAEVTGIATIFD